MNFHIRELWKRICSVFRKRELDEDFNDELSSHIDMATEENIQSGMSPLEARRQALIWFGGIDVTRELHRDARGLPLIEKIMLDARYAFRMFRKNPGFSLAVIITLALCIGANTAIFSMLDALIIKPLPFPDADRIVFIYTRYNDSDREKRSNVPQYLDFKENTDTFSNLALWQTWEFNLGIGDEAIRSPGASATAEIFEVLGLNPVLGRFFSIENDKFTGKNEIVLTQSFWKSHFQEDPGIIGRTIQVDGEAYEVVGIAPKTFESFDAQPRFIISMKWSLKQEEPQNRYMCWPFLLGRMKPEANFSAAIAQMTALERQALDFAPPFLLKMIDHDKLAVSMGMDTLQSRRIETDLRLKLYLLQGAVLFVLLIGCVNVINLFLSRANARQGELAVRIALGSGHRAIARQLFVESFLLTWIGTALGIVLAFFIIDIINSFTAQLLPKSLPFSIDVRMFAFTAMIATVTSLAIGLFQVFHVCNSNLLTLTLNQNQHVSSSRNLRSMSGGLVVAQMAITLILLVGGGLLIHSFANLLAVDPGFDPKQLVTARVDLPTSYDRQQFRQRLEGRLREIPGFTSISLSASSPYNGIPLTHQTFKLQDDVASNNTAVPYGFTFSVDSSYWETLRIPLIEGRWFNSRDTEKSRPVCIANQEFVRQYIPGRSAVGKRVASNFSEPEENWPEIVGVVGSVRDLRLEEGFGRSSLPAIYFPIQQRGLMGLSVLIRSPRPASEVISLIREKVKEIDPAVPLYRTGPMESIIAASRNERRAIMLLLCSFAGLALLLSAVGIYGVLAYDVSKRTHEIGIRGAIGATEKQIITMVLRQGLWRAGIGLVIGLTGAFYLSKFMTSLLFDVKPIDPLTFVLVPVLLLLVAILASYIPARQASRVDPALALRAE